MTSNDTYACPACEKPVHYHATSCPSCEADLGAVARLSEAPDVCFNAGLTAAMQKQWLDAIRHLVTALHYSPTDAGAWRLLGKVFAHQKRADEARCCFDIARAQRERTERSRDVRRLPSL